MAIQDADSFGPVEAMRRERKQVCAQRLDIDWHPAHGGFGIDIERDAFFVGDGGDLQDRFQRADLVIDQVNSDQNSLVSNGSADAFGIDEALGIDADARTGEAMLLQERNRIKHSRMLDAADNNMFS